MYIVPHQTCIYRSSIGETRCRRDENQDKQESPSPPQPKKVKTDYTYELSKEVPDDKLKTFPYQSVGLLNYMKVNSSGDSRNSCSTAWVVRASGYHIVITTAHTLKRDDEIAVNIQFTPGFNPHSPDPPEFGKYKQIPGGEGIAWAVHPKWDPVSRPAQFDIGIVHLDKDPKSGKYVDQIVTPIQMLSYPTYNTIGYYFEDKKMYEQEGTLYQRSRSGSSFYKHGKLPEGTSGSPMMFISDSDNSSGSIGVLVGTVIYNKKYPCLQSPYFTSTIDEMVKLWFS